MAVNKKYRESIMSKSTENHTTCEEKNQADKNKEVFKLIEDGLTNLEIAEIADISCTQAISYRIAYERRHANEK